MSDITYDTRGYQWSDWNMAKLCEKKPTEVETVEKKPVCRQESAENH